MTFKNYFAFYLKLFPALHSNLFLNILSGLKFPSECSEKGFLLRSGLGQSILTDFTATLKIIVFQNFILQLQQKLIFLQETK